MSHACRQKHPVWFFMVSTSIFNWRKSNSLHILPVVEWKNKQCASRQGSVLFPDQHCSRSALVPQQFDRPKLESH